LFPWKIPSYWKYWL